jgi:hypothetical protein
MTCPLVRPEGFARTAHVRDVGESPHIRQRKLEANTCHLGFGDQIVGTEQSSTLKTGDGLNIWEVCATSSYRGLRCIL